MTTHIRTLMDQMIQIDEGRMKDIFTADEEGKSAKEIAKALKLPLGTVKKILGEEEDLKEFTDSQLDVLARQYQSLAGKTISIDQANKLRKIFKGVPDRSLDALRRKKIPFLSGLALSRMVQKGMPVKEDTEEPKDTQNKSLKIKLDKEKDQDALEKQLVVAQGQINILKQKLENEKNKAVKPEPNKETGEVPLTVGIAHKLIKDKQEKEKEKDKKEVKEENDDINWAGKLEEAKYTINYEVESDSGADDRYVGNNDMTVNAFSPKDAVKKFGQELNKTVKQAQARGSRSILSVYMNYIEKDGNEISDREVDKLNDYASDLIYKGVYDSYTKEAFAVQVTKKDGGKFIHGTYKSKAEAEKFVKWYKTGDLRTTKKIEVVKEMAKDDAYAIGMAQAKKSMNDEKPLEKKTITKGHEIAKKILAKEARYRVTGTMGYRGMGGTDGFEMVINANSERDAENKAEKHLDRARAKRQIGPGGGGSIEDLEIEGAEKTNDPLEEPSHFRLNHFDPSMKEGKAPFRLSYDDRYGKHAGFEDAKTLADLQNKAANLRKRGFVINKMGRNTSPVKEETIMEFTSQQIKQAYGIANDPRYKAGNYDGAVKAIEKLAKGLSKHPDVAKVLKRTNESAHEGARLVFETIKGIKNKAEKSGMPYSILKKVYDRGMAAWRGGHRPGTTQQQWAFARVNSFVTKSSGTWGGADKDLAKQVRGKN